MAENTTNTLFCPCHGFTGWLSKKSDKVEGFFYSIWNNLIGKLYNHEKELFKVPIESACVASVAIYGDDGFCFRDNCEVHPQEPGE